MRKNKNKIGLGKYFAKYKFIIFIYILLYIISSLASVTSVVFLAKAIEMITIPDFKLAIFNLLLVIASQVIRRIC